MAEGRATGCGHLCTFRLLLLAWARGGGGGTCYWTGASLMISAPFAAEFGPGPEAEAEGQWHL